MHSKNVEDRQLHIARLLKVEPEDAEREENDWSEEVKIDHRLDTCDQLVGMITEFESLGDGHSGRRGVAKHCTDLKSVENRPLHCEKYGAGPMAL